jgi:hypothetical protein
MAAHTVELKKQRYSQELIEHTMRQWEQARLAMESRTKESASAPSAHPLSYPASHPSQPRSEKRTGTCPPSSAEKQQA